MCWDLEKDEIYSVCSAYKALVGDVWSASEEDPPVLMGYGNQIGVLMCFIKSK